MASPGTRERCLYFGPFRLDSRSGELYKEERRVRLPPQPARLLLVLVSSPGELVTRDEIQKALWSDDTFVDFDYGINKCVKQIRTALGNGSSGSAYIQTVSRRGYRFVGEVRGEGVEPVDRARSPYPGLSTFTELDAPFFHGREAEVEALWKAIEVRRLLAVIGPSGAGKSSFLRAGLLPACPAGFRAIYVTPGIAPVSALARALVPELSSEPDAIQPLVSLESRESVVEAVARWRKLSGEVLIVVDAFEELFTLSSRTSQKELATLLGRLATECGAHVLLSMRDDFLFHCHEHESLRPVFSELTPLGPLTGAALRRGLVEPALSCGYRFESEELID
jgi:DNA-binding winged helix-turn-helix (wHTH) protein